MSDVETRFLPLLPLSTGVVLPQMVVPLGLESDEAKAAADAALAGEGLLVLVPRVENEGGPTVYARVGTVAKIEEAGRLPCGNRAVLVSARPGSRPEHQHLYFYQEPHEGDRVLAALRRLHFELLAQ